ncbi:MAG TPA: ABC transporter substrate-binding protein [Actinopolymorphaceae bacterium]
MVSGRPERFTRRRLLRSGGAVVAGGSLLGACDFLSTDPSGKDGEATERAAQGREAPELAKLVKAGRLPPLGKRLPAKPLVVRPVSRKGTFGGTWRSALLGPGDAFRLSYTLGYENLVRWDLAWEKVLPNVAESVEANDDGTEYVLTLRSGMRWSDGEPFTADDIVFAYTDVLLNEKISPGMPGNPARVERVSDHEVRITFDEPEGLFLEKIASNPVDAITALPRHYLERFHEKYNPKVQQLADQERAADWVELFNQKAGLPDALWRNPELPRLHAWLPDNAVGEGDRMTFRRNPYYWKTDPDGRQLPYLDRITFDMVNSPEVLLLRATNGEIDLMDRHINVTKNKPVLARGREAGGYEFFDLASEKINTLSISLNMTSKNPTLRKVFGEKDFRVALSHAINRQEIIEAVHARQGKPHQCAPQPGSEFYDEEFAQQYTRYDTALANRLLDGLGFDRRNADGVRLGPDGRPLFFRIDAATGSGKPELIDALDMVRRYWREVGVDMRINPMDYTLYLERLEANEHDGAIWDGDGGLDVVLTPTYYVPVSTDSYHATEWGRWYESGKKEGVEPPPDVERQMELYDQLGRTTVPEERDKTMRAILQIAKEQFYAIGISTPPAGYGLVKKNLRNMPEKTFFAAHFPYPGATNPEQYFLDRS